MKQIFYTDILCMSYGVLPLSTHATVRFRKITDNDESQMSPAYYQEPTAKKHF